MKPQKRKLLCILFTLVATVAVAADYHVAPSGDDANSGSATKPFSSLERARDAIRALRAGKPYADAAMRSRIVMHGGTYYLKRALTLDPQDSNIVIEAAPGERVEVSGGRVVNGWQPVKGGIVKADLSHLEIPNLKFRELYSAGQRQHWARVPNFDPANPRRGGFLRNAGIVEPGTKNKFRFRQGELDPAKWKHPERGMIVFHDLKNYRQQWASLKSLDAGARVLEAATKGDYTLAHDSPYYLCGLLEELDSPGEWCVDMEAKMLHFWPPQGTANDVVIPALDSIFVFQGEPKADRWVRNVRLQGLDLTGCRREAIQMQGAERCEVIGCDLRNVGSGVLIGDDTHRCRVAGCDITQTQRDGVTIQGLSLDHSRVSDHVIDNNYIWDFGWGDIHNRCGGVFMNRCSRITVTHNHIHDGPRYAIGTDVGNDFEIAWNYCHHVNLNSSDSGIIEGGTAWDWSMPDDAELKRNRECNWGNRVHHNLIHDSGGWSPDSGEWRFPDFTWGIYLDLCNSGWQVDSNIVYDTVFGGFMQNAGMECRVENNVFAGGKRSQYRFNNWRGYTMSGHLCERNIIAYSGMGASLLEGDRVLPGNCRYARNLILCQSGRPWIKGIPWAGFSDPWAAWQAIGQDEGSVLADPRFVDAAHHDYRLRPESPAFKLGIRSLDLAAAGNYASPDRCTWPRPEEKVTRVEADYREDATDFGQVAKRDYEDYCTGEPERTAYFSKPEAGGPVATDETAARGRHSMRMKNPAGKDPKAGGLFINYPCESREGCMKISFSLRVAPGADFSCEWRNGPQQYQKGPAFRVDGQGRLMVAGKALMQLPAGEWIRLEAACDLGQASRGVFDLTVTQPNVSLQTFKDLPHDGKFKNIEALIFQLAGQPGAACWFDDLTFELQSK